MMTSFGIQLTLTYLSPVSYIGAVADVYCRIGIFLFIAGNDASAWYGACICLERFLLILLPTSSYAMNRSRITEALWITGIISGLVVAADFYILIISPNYCLAPMPGSYMLFKSFFRFIIPCTILVLAVIGLLVQLIKRMRRGSQGSTGRTGSTLDSAYTEAVFGAKLTAVVSILYLLASAGLFISLALGNTKFSDNQNLPCSDSDVVFLFVILISWMMIWIKTYVLLFAGSQARRDFRTFLSVKFRKFGRYFLRAFERIRRK